MSKAKPVGKKAPPRGPAAPAERAEVVFKPPLKPRRGLFYALMGGVAVWVGVLLTMYFTTVHSLGERDAATQPTGQREQTVAREAR